MATPYHGLARETPTYAWWRLPVAGGVALVAWLIAAVGLIVALLIALELAGRAADFDAWVETDFVSTSDPLFLGVELSLIAVMIPAVLVGVLIVGARPIGYLSSVEGRLRWRWLGLTSLLAFALSGLTIGVWVVVRGAGDDPSVSGPAAVDASMIVLLAVIVLLTPFQAAAEEYVFRGYLLQLIGSWTRFVAVGVVVTTVLFVFAHGYDLWGQIDVGLFGLAAAILVLRTGGLEAAISLHIANNVVLFVLGAVGILDLDTAFLDAGPWDVLPTVVSCAVFIGVVEWLARRRDLVRTREPLPEPEPVAPAPYPSAPYPSAPYPSAPYPSAPYPSAPYPSAPYAAVPFGTTAHPQHPYPPYPYPPQWPAPPAPVRRAVVPENAPPYPGELPEDWNRD